MHDLLSMSFPRNIDLTTATIQELQDDLAKGKVTSVQLVEEYLANDQQGLKLRAMLDIAPKGRVLAVAHHFDELRKQGVVLSPLHGIPILVTDSIATDDELGTKTTAGSIALANSVTVGEATVIAKLRGSGAIIIGKTNMSELSMFMGKAPNGLRARGGQCRSAYVPGDDPSGSSSGSAVGTSASRSECSLRHSIKQGFGIQKWPYRLRGEFRHYRSNGQVCLDTALLLGLIAGTDSNDTSTSRAVGIKQADYTQFTQPPHAAFDCKRLGIPRLHIFDDEIWGQWGNGPDLIAQVKKAFEQAIVKMGSLGATIVDPADVPSLDVVSGVASKALARLEFKDTLETYLYTLQENKVRTLEELIAFNNKHAESELPLGNASQQQLLNALEAEDIDSEAYRKAAAEIKELADEQGVDRLLDLLKLDALVAPCNYRMVHYAALSGCPIATVPLGQYSNGAPFGLCFVGRKGSEANLFALMAAFEANFPARPVPAQLQSN
ncbi:hypothetical protein NCC49_006102 [Naganishia albida]|nr:hypothetical protein NCC49_006102 [Naganishia albida]